MFGHRQVVVTLERDGILVDNQRWAYPAGTIVNQEVKDRNQFLKSWSDYWQSLGLKGASVLLVISDPLLFAKVSDHETVEFWDEVPIDAANLARKVIYEPDKVTMMATNRELFSLVVQGVEMSRGEVRAVVPANYAMNKETMKHANFLDELIDRPQTKSSNGWVWFLAGGIWIGVIILIWLKIMGKI